MGHDLRVWKKFRTTVFTIKTISSLNTENEFTKFRLRANISDTFRSPRLPKAFQINQHKKINKKFGSLPLFNFFGIRLVKYKCPYNCFQHEKFSLQIPKINFFGSSNPLYIQDNEKQILWVSCLEPRLVKKNISDYFCTLRNHSRF